MAKLARLPALAPRGPTSTVAPAVTHEGGTGFSKDPLSELFTLAITNFVGEDTFYEKASTRDARFIGLIHAAAQSDPDWTRAMITWLRTEANMRTASIVAAVEYCALGAPKGRQLVAATLTRADEPAEALAYWRATYGRKLPYALQRGLADAVTRLYTERAAVKWDSAESAWRMGDVIEVVHPRPKASWQAALYRYLIDRRHNRADPRTEGLEGIAEYRAWVKAPTLERVPKLGTWENVSAHTKMNGAAWDAVIPQMGYMAVLRNLRNFEDAGISEASRATVIAKLTDPGEVAASRQMPFRFWSAWKHSGTMSFGPALEMAFSMVLANIPHFDGKTLVLIDTSESMSAALSERSKIARMEAAAVFGVAVATRSDKALLVMYADNAMAVEPNRSALRTIERIAASSGIVGHGTQTWPSASAAWDAEGPFDRILVFTDGQDHPSRVRVDWPCPIYVWDLAGYRSANIEVGSNRYLLGGLNDQSFKLVKILEAGRDAGWPWEHSAD